MKIQTLKKRLAKESLIILPVLAVMGGGLFFLDSALESSTQEMKALELNVNQLMSEKTALHGQYDNVQKNMTLYEAAIVRNPLDGNFSGRQQAESKFTDFNNRYRMNNLRLTITQARDLGDARHKRKTSSIVGGELGAEFSTISDGQVTGLIEALQNELLGTTKVVAVKMVRTDMLSDKALQAIAQRGTYSLIKCEVRTQWMGIKPVETATPAGANVSR